MNLKSVFFFRVKGTLRTVAAGKVLTFPVNLPDAGQPRSGGTRHRTDGVMVTLPYREPWETPRMPLWTASSSTGPDPKLDRTKGG